MKKRKTVPGKLTGKVDEICKLYEMGESSPSLARAYGVVEPTILYHLHKHGIKVRKSCAVMNHEIAISRKPYQCEPCQCASPVQKVKRPYVRHAKPTVQPVPQKQGFFSKIKLMLAAIHA